MESKDKLLARYSARIIPDWTLRNGTLSEAAVSTVGLEKASLSQKSRSVNSPQVCVSLNTENRTGLGIIDDDNNNNVKEKEQVHIKKHLVEDIMNIMNLFFRISSIRYRYISKFLDGDRLELKWA